MKKILVLLLLGVLISCSNTNSQIVEDIEALEFYEAINKEDQVIIDMRTPEEFFGGHIKDASNIDFYSDDFLDKLEIIRKDIPIYVYCRSGGRSSLGANKMEALGFTKVYNLVGGIGAWEAANYKIIQSDRQEKSSQLIFSVSKIDILLQKNEVVLLYFSTEWCIPCKKMKPLILQIKKEDSEIEVLSIDADVNNDLIKKYKIKGIPVVILFKNNEEVFRHVGLISKKELLKHINSVK